MQNYFNLLNFRQKLNELKKCRLMLKEEFFNKTNALKEKKIVIIGCGSQGLNQGLNLRDSGLNVTFALRDKSIKTKNLSWKRAIKNNFLVDSYETLIPRADLIINLTPDKQHSSVVKKIQPLMKKNAVLGYSHGFNIVELGEIIRKDITVIMVAPKCPGTEVREEYKRGFGVPTLIAVHSKNNINNNGLEIAKAWAVGIGGHRAGVLESSFIAEVKSDLMGEQTVLCGMLQVSSVVCYEYLINKGNNADYAGKLIQFGWEVITESLKQGGINLMLDRLSNSNKIRAYILSKKLKNVFSSLFKEHMDNIISGSFSEKMIKDWNNEDKQLLHWRKQSRETNFENAPKCEIQLPEQEYFDHGVFMVAILKTGIELAFETMVETGIMKESAYYESLHELPLIANTIARKRLYDMNMTISDTAEYGNYLFYQKALPILTKFTKHLKYGDLGCLKKEQNISNTELNAINIEVQNHPIEIIGKKLRNYMTEMKNIKTI